MLRKRKKNFFTPEQDAFIIEHYPTMRTDEMCNVIGHPINGIKARAQHLGVKKEKWFTAMLKGEYSKKRQSGLELKKQWQIIREKEKRRLIMGLPQLTKLPISFSTPEKRKRKREIRNRADSYTQTELNTFCYTYKPHSNTVEACKKFNIKLLDMKCNIPIITFKATDINGNEVQGTLHREGGKCYIIDGDGKDEIYSNEVLPDTIEHVKTEYIHSKQQMK